MLAYCVNPSCYAPLHSFSEGRLFQFEIISISVAASDDTTAPFDEKPERQAAQFWLCGHCASSMTLLLEPVKGLRLVPLELGGELNQNSMNADATDGEFRQPHNC